ncbi:unnamed protein product [Caenorhabditis nigoni]
MSSIATDSTARFVPAVERAIAARLRSENNWNPVGQQGFSETIARRWIKSISNMDSMEKCRIWVETKGITSHLFNNQR